MHSTKQCSWVLEGDVTVRLQQSQLNPQTGLMVLKGTAVWTLLVEPCRPEPHLHALASAVHRPQWRSFKEDGELPEGWKASGSKDPDFYCTVCFTFAPRREEANTFIITSASDRIELFRGEKETRRLSESRIHTMSLKIKLCSKSECIKAHSVFVHTEEDTGRTNSADSRISLHSSGSTSVRTAAADTRELMLGSQHQLSSAQPKPAGPGRGQKTRRGKHFSLSTYEGNQTVIIIRKNRLIHELNDSQTSSNLQPYVLHTVFNSVWLSDCRLLTALTAAADQCNVKLLVS